MREREREKRNTDTVLGIHLYTHVFRPNGLFSMQL